MSLSSVSSQHVLSRSGSDPTRGPRTRLTIPGWQDSGVAEHSLPVGRSEFQQPERGRDSRGPGVPVESSASGFPGPPQREPQRRAQPRTAVEQGNCSPGRPGSALRGESGQDSRAPCHSAAGVSSLSISQKETPFAKRRLQDLWESESCYSPGWLGVLAQGLPARGPLASDLRGMRGRASTTAPSGARLGRIRGEMPTDLGSSLWAPSEKMKQIQRAQTFLRPTPSSA